MRSLLVTLHSSCSSVAQGSGVSNCKAAVLCGRGFDNGSEIRGPSKVVHRVDVRNGAIRMSVVGVVATEDVIVSEYCPGEAPPAWYWIY